MTSLYLSNGLVGLSILTGTNSMGVFGTSLSSFETRAVRQAKALFTTPPTTPPWSLGASNTPMSAQVSAVKRMLTIIDKPTSGNSAYPQDVQTAFTTYKALDRLRVLAETAAKAGTSASDRASLQTAFAKGLEDLQGFLGSAASSALNLAFGQPARRAESVPMLAPAGLLTTEVAGKGVIATRSAALPGLTGTEKFQITLSRGSVTDVITVDLAGTQQPPTLDSVADAINSAIAAIPSTSADGGAATNVDGTPATKWSARFKVEKHGDKWGLSISRNGLEKVGIDQIGAKDALMVAAGVSGSTTATSTRVLRLDDPLNGMEPKTLGTISAVDRLATDRAELAAEAAAAGKPPAKDAPAKTTAPVMAATTAAGIATDAAGFSYVVGTTAGDVGANRAQDGNDMMLSKLDSEGRVVWQRSLGAAGNASGAAVTIAPGGDIVVAATVQGSFDGISSDGDMAVVRFDASGDEKFATVVRGAGADSASAVAVGQDGSIFVGGKAASGQGDAFLVRMDAAGRLQQRRVIDSGGSDGVTALAIDADGSLLALTREGTEAKLRRISATSIATDEAVLSLGNADARALAVAADGSIAIGGATSVAVSGTQANAMAGGRDGFVARVDAGLGGAAVTYIGTGSDDQVDSLAFLDGALYVGGRTTGALGGAKSGTTDGFITRIDGTTGEIEDIRQFGQAATRVEPVRISAVAGGSTALGALGLHRGTLTPENSAKLVAQTSLRPGDEFMVRVNGGSVRKITITEADTLTTLADRIRRITGSSATVSTPKSGEGNVLRIDAKAGASIDLIGGPDGKDALAKLGLPEARIVAAATVATNAPKVRPGGSFGLGLSEGLAIGSAQDAALALSRIKQAISMTQTGYRSLYWDDGKAALVNGPALSGAVSGRLANQMAQYQAALDRLSSGPSTSFGF
jgi:hypothetical protein